MRLRLLLLLIISSMVFVTAMPSHAEESSDAVQTQKQKDVRKLLEIKGSKEHASRLGVQFLNALHSVNPLLPKEDMQTLKRTIKGEELQTELFESWVPIYDDLFTHKEIKELVRFFESPTGKKFTAMQPEIMRRSSEEGRKIGEKMAGQLKNKLSESPK